MRITFRGVLFGFSSLLMVASFAGAQVNVAAGAFSGEVTGSYVDLAYQTRNLSEGVFESSRQKMIVEGVPPSAGPVNGTQAEGLDRVGFVYTWSITPVAGSPDSLNMRFFSLMRGGDGTEGFGKAVSSGVDIDGDGYDDVVVGAPEFDDGRGRVYVVSGNTAAVLFTLDGPAAGERFGAAVAVVGAAGEARKFLVIGAPNNSATNSAGGRVYVFDASTRSLERTITGDSDHLRIGTTVEGTLYRSPLNDLMLRIGASCEPLVNGAVVRTLRSYEAMIQAAGQGASQIQDALLPLRTVISNFGTAGPAGDLNGDGVVNYADLDMAVDQSRSMLEGRSALPGMGDAGDYEPLCAGWRTRVLPYCLRRLCTEIQDAVDTLKGAVQQLNIGLNTARSTRDAAMKAAQGNFDAAMKGVRGSALTNCSAVGLLGAAAGGAGAGAGIGTIVGTIFPGIGTAAGIVVGGVAGAVVGPVAYLLTSCTGTVNQAQAAQLARTTAEQAAGDAFRIAEEDYASRRDAFTQTANRAIVKAQHCYPCCLTYQALGVVEAGCNDCNLGSP